MPDVGKVDVGPDSEGDLQTTALPGQSTQLLAWDLQSVQVLGEREDDTSTHTEDWVFVRHTLQAYILQVGVPFKYICMIQAGIHLTHIISYHSSMYV